MLARAARRKQVNHAPPSADEPVRDMPAMALVAAERLAAPLILDPGPGEDALQAVLRELRVAAGRGIGAHVGQRLDSRFLQDGYEFRGATRAVPDGVDQAALAVFFSSAFGAPAFFFFSSGFGSAATSAASSVSITSASGALSPLRKPALRMRR